MKKIFLKKITELRSQSDVVDNVIDQGKAESSLSSSLMNLFAVTDFTSFIGKSFSSAISSASTPPSSSSGSGVGGW